jgi:Haem-NO-binding
MLGMVFTEFIELVEEKFSPDMADAVIQDVAPANGGAYTAVGYYPHEEMTSLVGALSVRTGVPVADLVKAFGHHLLQRFTQVHSPMFSRYATYFDLVAAIDGHIHVEVRQLYDRATLPSFTVLSRSDTEVRLLYQSPRRLELLAVGLLEAAAQHFGERVQVAHEPTQGEDGAPATLFILTRLSA